FSSRRRHTRCYRDWSSDVCSSDLRLRVVDAEEATPYLFTTIRELRRELNGRTALIGFAGAPYTVASYLIEGRPTRDFARVKAMKIGRASCRERVWIGEGGV